MTENQDQSGSEPKSKKPKKHTHLSDGEMNVRILLCETKNYIRM